MNGLYPLETLSGYKFSHIMGQMGCILFWMLYHVTEPYFSLNHYVKFIQFPLNYCEGLCIVVSLQEGLLVQVVENYRSKVLHLEKGVQHCMPTQWYWYTLCPKQKHTSLDPGPPCYQADLGKKITQRVPQPLPGHPVTCLSSNSEMLISWHPGLFVRPYRKRV